MNNTEWTRIRIMLKAWGAPNYDDEVDVGYRLKLNDLDPTRVGQAINYVGERDQSNFRPSADVIKGAYDRLQEPGAPRWTRAERMAVHAVTRRTRQDGENSLKRQDGGEYVLAWLMDYGWQRFATEPQDSYTYNAQRKSYEEHIAGAVEDKAARSALGGSTPRPKEVGPARRLDPSQALPWGSEGAHRAPASRMVNGNPNELEF